MKSGFNLIFALLIGTLLAACGGKSGGNKTGAGENPNSILWEQIPAEFNPHVDHIESDLRDSEIIKMNLFGFSQDVRVQYSPDLNPTRFKLELFTVSKNARTSLGGVDMREDGKTLQLSNYGSYECSIKTSNRQITDLKGACYIKVVLTLPVGAEVEVYNVGQILTRRFHAMDNQTLLKNLKSAWSNEKMAVIDSYLASYQAVGRSPGLLSSELGQVIHEFSFSEQKFQALKKLHSFVLDRENLRNMIEAEFSYFDREEARKIVGVN